MPEPHATRLIRIPADLADKLSWIAELEHATVAELVDPLIRPEVERRYQPLIPAVRKIEAAKAEVTAASKRARR